MVNISTKQAKRAIRSRLWENNRDNELKTKSLFERQRNSAVLVFTNQSEYGIINLNFL